MTRTKQMSGPLNLLIIKWSESKRFIGERESEELK